MKSLKEYSKLKVEIVPSKRWNLNEPLKIGIWKDFRIGISAYVQVTIPKPRVQHINRLANVLAKNLARIFMYLINCPHFSNVRQKSENVFPNVRDILTQPNSIQSRLSCDYLIESPRILKTVPSAVSYFLLFECHPAAMKSQLF